MQKPTPMQQPKNKNSTRMDITYKFSNITKILRSLHFSFYFAMVGVC